MDVVWNRVNNVPFMFLNNYGFTQLEQNMKREGLMQVANKRVRQHIEDLDDLGLKDEVVNLHNAAELHPDRASFAHGVQDVDGLVAFEQILYSEARLAGPWPAELPGLDDVREDREILAHLYRLNPPAPWAPSVAAPAARKLPNVSTPRPQAAPSSNPSPKAASVTESDSSSSSSSVVLPRRVGE